MKKAKLGDFFYGKPEFFVAGILQRFEYCDEDVGNPRRRCYTHENIILIKAKTSEAAYKKAVHFGKLCEKTECVGMKTGRKGEWHFVGLTALSPVRDKFMDGSEILWFEHAGRSVSTIERMVIPKKDLLGSNKTAPI
jgi:Domain of unknown function (DUF4288)